MGGGVSNPRLVYVELSLLWFRCSDPVVSDKERYPTFTRMEPTDTQVWRSFIMIWYDCGEKDVNGDDDKNDDNDDGDDDDDGHENDNDDNDDDNDYQYNDDDTVIIKMI